MKRCSHCGETKALGEFGRRQSWCRRCRVDSKRAARAANPDHYRAKGREYRKTDRQRKRHLEWKRHNREKVLAHKAVNRAIAAGRLIRPMACPQCGVDDVQIHAHHEDYSRQLDVKWLCPRCHSVAHGRVAMPPAKETVG